nr:sigma 54-interacting transcriptional regulator [Alcanivorax quisquiliarum]
MWSIQKQPQDLVPLQGWRDVFPSSLSWRSFTNRRVSHKAGVCTPVGGAAELRVDVRLIAATHRNLMVDVAGGRFREDLFYRVAVGVLQPPPLRQREDDLLLSCDVLLTALGPCSGR